MRWAEVAALVLAAAVLAVVVLALPGCEGTISLQSAQLASTGCATVGLPCAVSPDCEPPPWPDAADCTVSFYGDQARWFAFCADGTLARLRVRQSVFRGTVNQILSGPCAATQALEGHV
jgi:hypothetical protein